MNSRIHVFCQRNIDIASRDRRLGQCWICWSIKACAWELFLGWRWCGCLQLHLPILAITPLFNLFEAVALHANWIVVQRDTILDLTSSSCQWEQKVIKKCLFSQVTIIMVTCLTPGNLKERRKLRVSRAKWVWEEKRRKDNTSLKGRINAISGSRKEWMVIGKIGRMGACAKWIERRERERDSLTDGSPLLYYFSHSPTSHGFFEWKKEFTFTRPKLGKT